MAINDYYKHLFESASLVFDESNSNREPQATIQINIQRIKNWEKIISDNYECSHLLNNAIVSMDTACLQMMLGMYRAAFASLRLSLEMVCAFISFSSNDYEYRGWKIGDQDLIWAKLTCNDSGVFSRSFIKRYLNSLESSRIYVESLARESYSKLSKNVHGNFITWNENTTKFHFNQDARSEFKTIADNLGTIAEFLLCVRFFAQLTEEQKDEFRNDLLNAFGANAEFREFIGGPK